MLWPIVFAVIGSALTWRLTKNRFATILNIFFYGYVGIPSALIIGWLMPIQHTVEMAPLASFQDAGRSENAIVGTDTAGLIPHYVYYTKEPDGSYRFRAVPTMNARVTEDAELPERVPTIFVTTTRFRNPAYWLVALKSLKEETRNLVVPRDRVRPVRVAELHR